MSEEEALPPVDVEGFRSAMRGVEDVVARALELYVGEAPGLMNSLESAVGAGDATGVLRAAHTLKSSSANIRATHLSELFRRLEDTGNAGDLDASTVLLGEVRDEYRAVMDYLASLD